MDRNTLLLIALLVIALLCVTFGWHVVGALLLLVFIGCALFVRDARRRR